jgi:hypothetical protein
VLSGAVVLLVRGQRGLQPLSDVCLLNLPGELAQNWLTMQSVSRYRCEAGKWTLD